jgi:ABC-type bacteriocin/lantibiotic exporter with double-glycine peptidase domain
MLDEPTSALALGPEAEIIQAIRQLGRSITVIAITHRISFTRACDRVLGIKDLINNA